MDEKLKIKDLEDKIETLKMKLESSESVKNGEIGMNQALKIQIQKQKEYINTLVELNDKYVGKIAKLKGDLEFFLSRQ